MNPNLDLPLSAYACFYLQLTRRERKIFQYLRWYQNRYQENSFPKMSKIAAFSGLSIRAVQKFFAKLKAKNIKEFYLTVNPRYNKRGGNTTNQYILNKYFKMSMNWLEIHGFLNSPKKKIKSIILSMQNGEKVHPPHPQKFTPLSKDYSSSKDKETLRTVWIYPSLKNLGGLDKCAKEYASRFASQHEVQETLEACRYQEKIIKMKNPSSYFMGTLKKKIKERRMRC